MKTLALCILFFSMAVSFSMQCYAEDIALKLDNREWELGYNAENNQEGIQEYVLKGETVNNWSELITVQAFFGLQKKTTPEQFMDSMIKRLKEISPNLASRVIRKGDKEVIFDWEVKNTPGQADQYEIDRVISGSEAIWHLHYATKKLPVSSDKRSEWIDLLSASNLQAEHSY